MSVTSERITALREQRGWSKTYVAKNLGLNLSTYANYEYGNREPDIKTLADIAELFGVTTDYLIDGNKQLVKEKKIEDDLNKAIDNSRSFDGKPISDKDREIVKKILRGYFE
ncbi:helix-turn-helix domain-containing protein [Limosilactobacillus portuensis]|uniref:Helix-turn-helix domain-containing protein n=1 Tax=Limosilactobacillus portuensis TaxID=2742601 RepID=A0ABS6IV88_9LACO|nr:helix-turn-helix transcriptional regulator [Limosilactobacillus portuensis]MBU9695212.1 helix-turn-helix domain-containing protein [Limosilactobacillus portuensis]